LSVIEHIAQRPLLGYGYHGFWTPDRVYEMSLEQEWTVPNAHSTYLDVVLNTGLLGGAVLGFCLVVTFRKSSDVVWRPRSRRTVSHLHCLFMH